MILPRPPADTPPALARLVMPPPPPDLPSTGGDVAAGAQRDEMGRFRFGNRGGNGRPAVAAEVKKLARNYGPDAIATLVELMVDIGQPGHVRKSAADSLLDRGYGKAVQQVEIAAAGVFEEMDAEELRAYVRSKAALLIDGTTNGS